MDWTWLLLPLGAGWYWHLRAQQARVALLSAVLRRFQVEQLMQTVADGYLRALGEADAQRAQQIWSMLDPAEQSLCSQVQELARAVDALDPALTQFSTLPLGLPLATMLFSHHQADLRALLHIHARGLAAVRANADGLARKDQAFMLTAELLLLQHSCHWFCRSKATASARMRARHGTPHAQLLASVSAPTRLAYTRMLA